MGDKHYHRGGSGALYGLGVLGAAVYYIQISTGFWAGALGVLKAFFWPAFVVHKVFTMLAL
jgi:hypothetical protein